MRVLITGARGFVGQQLVPRLERDGHHLFTRSHREQGPWPTHIDAVAHLAGRAHVLHETSPDPEATYRQANVDYALEVARAALAGGAQRFVYLSSAKVNGESADAEHPFRESDTPQPQDAYARSKWQAEQQLRTLLGERLVVLRPCLVYGPGVRANFRTLLKLADKGLPLPLAAVKNQRSLVFIGNLVDAVALCLQHPAAGGKTFLLSDGQDFSTGELFTELSRHLGRTARLFAVPPFVLKSGARLLGQAAVAQRLLSSLVVDSSAIRRTLNWQAPYDARTALRLSAEAYQAEGKRACR